MILIDLETKGIPRWKPRRRAVPSRDVDPNSDVVDVVKDDFRAEPSRYGYVYLPLVYVDVVQKGVNIGSSPESICVIRIGDNGVLRIREITVDRWLPHRHERKGDKKSCT
jgi:hypothetical protein